MELENCVEGHIKWLQELAHDIPPNTTLESHCSKLLICSEIVPGSTGVNWKEWSTTLTKKLNLAAMSILCGNTKKTLALLDQLDNLLEKNLKEATGNQGDVFRYCRDVLWWKNSTDKDSDEVEAKRLRWKWAVLKCDGGNEMMATICFLKGSLGLELGMDLEKIHKFYLEAIQLDPDCMTWYNHAYLSAREIRFRSKLRNSRKSPSMLERSLADKAYKLCEGKNMIAAAHWGIVNKEVWMRKNGIFWKENFVTYLKILEHLENALKVAQGSWIMKLKTHLAEFLYFGKGPKEDKLRGREMLLKLEQKYLYSTPVLYLVGQLYFGEGDVERARKCYERVLKVDPTGGICLSDYLNLLKRDHRDGNLEEIVRVMKTALAQKNNTPDSKKFFLKQLDLAEKKIKALKNLEKLMDH